MPRTVPEIMKKKTNNALNQCGKKPSGKPKTYSSSVSEEIKLIMKITTSARSRLGESHAKTLLAGLGAGFRGL